MKNDQYKKQKKEKQLLNERNLKSVVDYMNLQRRDLNTLREDVHTWKKTVATYVKIVTDLQREVEQLRNEVQVNRFSGGSSTKSD